MIHEHKRREDEWREGDTDSGNKRVWSDEQDERGREERRGERCACTWEQRDTEAQERGGMSGGFTLHTLHQMKM